ncbi:TAXI family TRAP transporter solute-binding subunit [Roseomonas terrae]|jgi:TRAP transporter TAXI family solute receptor|uniref:TAXI family TRAP transporter solute-binding subunit n=1 Tax=Neoroseomonas terrae TaxID=424799 RepID=A0ABS5EFX9_9PROT|nr:TAXI family TRAP transporter solute-binding subunit [Neoroseomonas terrae]MBR0649880.1 TAXI family TRAP transporter solute-binding subunit [Neoroseomonas terrae]
MVQLMRHLIAILLLLVVAACGEQPDAAQLRRDVEARLRSAFPDQALALESVERQGRMETLDGGRVVHFKAELRVVRPTDLGQWGGPNAQLLAGVLGAGRSGITGLTQGGNAAGDTLTVFGTVPYRREGNGWAAAAVPGPVDTTVEGPPGQQTPAERLLASLGETLRAAPAHTAPSGDAIVAQELEIARRNIEARFARLTAGYPLAAGPPGGAYARLATALAADAQARGVRMVVLPTAGSVENLTLLRDSRVSLAFAQADVAALAVAGRGPFAEVGPNPEIRALMALFPEQLHIVVRADDPAQGIGDLAGRRVATGLAGSGSRVTAAEALAAAGVHVEDPADARTLDPRASLAALAARRVDAVMLVGAAPFPPVVEAFGAAPLRLLPVDAALADRVRGAGLVALPIPAGAYAGQPGAVPALAVAALLVTEANLTEAEARRIGEAVLGRVSDAAPGRHSAREREPLALMVTAATAARGIPIPLHPAAEALIRAERR